MWPHMKKMRKCDTASESRFATFERAVNPIVAFWGGAGPWHPAIKLGTAPARQHHKELTAGIPLASASSTSL